MKKTFFALISSAALAGSGYANTDFVFNHSQEINYADDGLPTAIEVGQIADLNLNYTDSDFSSLTFSIEQAGISASTETIEWETSTNSSGYGVFSFTGYFDDIVISDKNFERIDYTFTSKELGDILFPDSFDDFAELADFSFTFSDFTGDTSTGVMWVGNYSYSATMIPEHKLTSLLVASFMATFIAFSRRRKKA